MEVAIYPSPIGFLEISVSLKGINSIKFSDASFEVVSDNLILQEALKQLKAYFHGDIQYFDLPLELNGTEFQLEVWQTLSSVPFGSTITYLGLSKKLGNPKLIRAVAQANARNPVPIIIPCHRVIGSDGRLTGYAGGLWRKQWLLDHERVNRQGKLF
jgi:methylated-DNA-[protein]-cysteine S-methyltransferase